MPVIQSMFPHVVVLSWRITPLLQFLRSDLMVLQTVVCVAAVYVASHWAAMTGVVPVIFDNIAQLRLLCQSVCRDLMCIETE